MKSQKSEVVRTTLQVSALGALALLLVGCGSTAVPNAEFADTKGVTSAAEASGAQETPQASLFLKMGTDGLEVAKEQMAKGDNKGALKTLQEAKADARLAISLTSNAQVEEQAVAALKQVDDLQSQKSVQD